MIDTLINTITGLFVLFLGASIGSFINVVVYRIPAGLSLLWPPSRCPHCLTRLKATENIPVFGWLRLKGKCAHCKSPISKRYPTIEATSALLFLLVYSHFGLQLQTLGYWAFFSWLLALSLIDFDTMTLPNPLTQTGLIAGLIFQTIIGFSNNQIIPQFMFGIFGMVLGIWMLDIISITGSLAFGRAAMGAGDAKLAAMMGAWLGWQYLLVAGFLACTTGAVVGSTGIALGWLERNKPMPFGPFLALGAAITTIWGQPLLSAYLKTFFPLQ